MKFKEMIEKYLNGNVVDEAVILSKGQKAFIRRYEKYMISVLKKEGMTDAQIKTAIMGMSSSIIDMSKKYK